MIIGLDINSFSIAIAALEDKELVVAQLFANKKKPFPERFEELVAHFDRFIRKLQPEAVYIEEIPYVQSQKVAMTLTAVQTLVRTICSLHNIPCYLIHNLTWKKNLGVRGTGSRSKILKTDTQLYVTQLFNITDELTEDQYDAACIIASTTTDRDNLKYSGKYESEVRSSPESSTEKSLDEGVHKARKTKSKKGNEEC